LTSPLDNDATGGRTTPWMQKVAGAALLGFGMAALGALAWFSYRLMAIGRTPDLSGIGILAVLAVVGWFCCAVGWRLLLNRPNRYGSILSPLGWRALGVIFGLMGVAVALFTALAQGTLPLHLLATTLVSVAGVFVFAFWCFKAARHFSTRKTGGG
jgi:hypothetical protein